MSTWTINVYYSTAASFSVSQSASQSSLFRAQCLAILAHDMAVVGTDIDFDQTYISIEYIDIYRYISVLLLGFLWLQ